MWIIKLQTSEDIFYQLEDPLSIMVVGCFMLSNLKIVIMNRNMKLNYLIARMIYSTFPLIKEATTTT